MKLIKTKHSFFKDLFRINREYEAYIDGDFDLKHFKMQFYRSKRFETNFKDGKIDLEYYSFYEASKIFQKFNINIELDKNKLNVIIKEPIFLLIYFAVLLVWGVVSFFFGKLNFDIGFYILSSFIVIQFIVFRIWFFSSLKSCIQYIELY